MVFNLCLSPRSKKIILKEIHMKKKSIAVALSLALGLASLQGCIGTFKLTGKVLNFNRVLGINSSRRLYFLL